MQKEIYFDNSATTRPYDEVAAYIDFINRNVYGNPSSLHKMGIEAEKIIKKSRDLISDTLEADSKEIYFTSGGTEANNLAVLGFLEANLRKGKHIITTQIEHPSVLEVFKYLEGKGYRIDYLRTERNGIIDLHDLEAKIGSDTSLISIIYVNNEVGSVQPIEEIVRIKNRINKDACLHIDAVQAYGKLKLSPKKSGIGMLSMSSHKIHGPKGTGALFVDKSVRIKPVLLGGGQESLLRSGTENVSGIGGFGLAAEIIHKAINENYSKLSNLKKLFIEKLEENIEGFKLISPENALPVIVNVSFPGVKAEVLLHHLEEKKIYVSTGAACSSRKKVHSHVLKALEIEPNLIEGSVRFSFSALNDGDEILAVVDALKEILPKIRIKSGGRR